LVVVEGEGEAERLGDGNEAGGGGVVAGAGEAARDGDEVGRGGGGPAGVAAGRRVEADEADDGAFKAGLFVEFAKDGGFGRLVAVDEPAGERQGALEGRVAAADEEDAAPAEDDGVGGEGVAGVAVGAAGDA
jgi:hypothetical protein